MNTFHIALCVGLLFPVSDDPFRDRTPDEVDPHMASGTSGSEQRLTEQRLAMVMLHIRSTQSARSGIELPPSERAKLEKLRRKKTVDEEGIGDAQVAPVVENGHAKATDNTDVPKTAAEFDRRYKAWSEAEEGTRKLRADLSKKIATGTASETDRRAYDILCDSRLKALEKSIQRSKELKRDYDLESIK